MNEHPKLAQVRALLAKAEASSNDAEKQAYFEKADEIMERYALSEQMVRAAGTDSRQTDPVRERMTYAERYTEWNDITKEMLTAIARFAGVRVATYTGGLHVDLVGFPSDVRYVEQLFTGAKLTFLSKLEPHWEPDLSEDENIARLKDAGRTWGEISDAGGFDGPKDTRMFRAYKRQCKREGREPLGTSRVAAYRKSFAQGFQSQLNYRLELIKGKRARVHADVTAETGVSSELVLADRSALVDAAFYREFPTLSPAARKQARAEAEAELVRQEAQALAERNNMLNSMTEKQRQAFYAKEQRQRERDARASDKWYEEYLRRNRPESAGLRAGTRAADQVDLGSAGQVTKGQQQIR